MGGGEVRAARVVSNMDVRRTCLRQVDEGEVPEEFLARVKRFKTRGPSGKPNIALDRAPRFAALPEGAPYLKGDLHFTPTIAAMERVYADWKIGTFSADPVRDVMIPPMIDPYVAPAGSWLAGRPGATTAALCQPGEVTVIGCAMARAARAKGVNMRADARVARSLSYGTGRWR